MADSDRLTGVILDEAGLSPPTPEAEQERLVAIHDLLESNRFALPSHGRSSPPAGPYQLRLAIHDRRLTFDVTTADGEAASRFHLSLTPLAQVIKDYFEICESYLDAVRRLPPARIEALDNGRRGIHDEGSRRLLELLEGRAEIDMATARRLFTLICALHPIR